MVADLKSGNLEDMAKAIDGDGDGIGSELGKIKEDINLNQIGQDVREVQKAGRDDAQNPLPYQKVKRQNPLANPVQHQRKRNRPAHQPRQNRRKRRAKQYV